MFFLKYIILFYNIITIFGQRNETEKELTVNEIANHLVSILDMNAVKSKKINELKKKIEIIDSYVIDTERFDKLLTNVSIDTSLNETNFYMALMHEEVYRNLLDSEPKNLYLKLKEKMNRDDIFHILEKKSGVATVKKTARKMGGDLVGNVDDNDAIEEVVDKIIAEVPKDDHKFDFKKMDHKYWDPQRELEDLKEYHQHDGRRIFKGERTTIRYYPFMVSVHVMGRFWCGGALYWHDIVITSASCLQLMHNNRFFRENPRVLQVRVGSNHSRISGELVDALEVYFHPGYNPRDLRHNIALIRLRRHLFFSYHRVPKLIEISNSGEGLAATSEVMVLGWGVTKMSQKMSFEPIFLQRKILPVYPNLFCKEVYGKKFINNKMFCAGTMSTGEGACDHDAGGPAIQGGKLVGIISFGPTVCGFPNAPTVFTLVGTYAKWIRTVNETMPDYYRGKARTTTTTPYTTPFFFDFNTPLVSITPYPSPSVIENNIEPAPATISMRFNDNEDDTDAWGLDIKDKR